MKNLTVPHVVSFSVIAVGLVLGVLSWLAPFPDHVRETLQVAGLVLPLVGSSALGFLWLIHSANVATEAHRAVLKTWALQPAFGFSLGSLGGIVLTGHAYPGSLFGLVAGSFLAWVYRRAKA